METIIDYDLFFLNTQSSFSLNILHMVYIFIWENDQRKKYHMCVKPGALPHQVWNPSNLVSNW